MSKSICFVALNSYNLFAPRSDLTHIGGAEVQQREVALWLVEQGYRISFITKDHGQADGAEVSGIRIFTAYDESAGLPLVRFFHPRWSGLRAALQKADADVYYQRGAGSETGQIAHWCASKGKKFVYACASEGDCLAELPFIRRDLDRWIYTRGLKSADAVIAQTSRQQQLLKDNFERSSQVVRNVMRAPQANGCPVKTRNNRPKVLWVGRLAPVKRGEWLLEIAKRFPQIDFELIGSSNANNEYSRALMEQLHTVPNIFYAERLNREKLFERYQIADAVLSTSIVEGFPNTFIESWYFGLPVICTYDPDGLVATHNLGWFGDNLDDLTSGVEALLAQSEEDSSQMAARIKAFAEQTFHPDQALPGLQTVIEGVLAG